MSKLNKDGPGTEPCGIPLVTGLQLDPVPLTMTFWDLLFSQFPICPLIQSSLSLSMRIL